MEKQRDTQRRGGLQLILVTVTLALLQACSPGNDQTGFMRRDSVGVTIVESVDPRWGDGEEWPDFRSESGRGINWLGFFGPGS